MLQHVITDEDGNLVVKPVSIIDKNFVKRFNKAWDEIAARMKWKHEYPIIDGRRGVISTPPDNPVSWMRADYRRDGAAIIYFETNTQRQLEVFIPMENPNVLMRKYLEYRKKMDEKLGEWSLKL